MAPDRHLEWSLNAAGCLVCTFIPANFHVNDGITEKLHICPIIIGQISFSRIKKKFLDVNKKAYSSCILGKKWARSLRLLRKIIHFLGERNEQWQHVPYCSCCASHSSAVFFLLLCCERQYMCGHSSGVLGKHQNRDAKLQNQFFPASIYGAEAVFLDRFLCAAGWFYIWLLKLPKKMPIGLV